MQMKGKFSWAKHIDFMIVDLVAMLLSFLTAFLLKFGNLSLNEDWLRFMIIITAMNLAIYFAANPYSGIFRRRYYSEIGRAFGIVLGNALGTVLVIYVMKLGEHFSREVVIYTYIIYFLVSVVLKYIWKRLLYRGKIRLYTANRTTIFLFSTRETAEKDIHSIYSTDLPLYEIKGVYLIDDDQELPEDHTFIYREGRRQETVPIVKNDPVRFVLENNISEVMVAAAPHRVEQSTYKELIDNGVEVDLILEPMMGFRTEEQFITNIGVNKALSVGTFSFSPSQSFYMIVKRFFDIIISLIGVILLLPVTGLVKLAYLLSGDKAKIFYRQTRVGLNGKTIRIWKFRSMVSNADEILQELLKDEKYREEWEKNQKFENDPRITKVGNILRKTSIDEMPQFINVLTGDMSLVGPRPLVVGELAFHNGLKLYEKVKPGITGWWGCNGRSSIDYHERLELEYYYVKNCSLYLDVMCIIRTIFAVLERNGAQ